MNSIYLNLKKILLMLLFGFMNPFIMSPSAQADGLKIYLEDLQGNYHSISEYIGDGKWTLVNVWSPSCIQCVIEMPDLNKFHLEHRDIDATVLGITIDYPSFQYGKKDLTAAFIKKHSIDFPIFMGDQDIALKVSGKRLIAIPSTYFFHPEGQLVARWSGMVQKEELEEFIRQYEPETNDWFQ